MIVYIASDHGGFTLKKALAEHLQSQAIDVKDLGPKTLDMEDDYPDLAIPLLKQIQKDPTNKGILICRSGIGMDMIANRFSGIRAAVSWNKEHAESSRADDDTNVLSLPADYISEEEAKEITDTWLTTLFSGKERHRRRLEKVQKYDNTRNS
jgi:RpiB/LacA/LacB family sugar-phosphate isomerase